MTDSVTSRSRAQQGVNPWRGAESPHCRYPNAVGKTNPVTGAVIDPAGVITIMAPGTYRAMNEQLHGVIVAQNTAGDIVAAAETFLLWPMLTGWVFRAGTPAEFGDFLGQARGLSVQRAGPWVPLPS